MLLKELMQIQEVAMAAVDPIAAMEAAFEKTFSKVVDHFKFSKTEPMFDSSATKYGLEVFFETEKMLMSLLPEEDDDFIGIIGKDGDNYYYVTKSGKGKVVSQDEAKALITDTEGVGFMKF